MIRYYDLRLPSYVSNRLIRYLLYVGFLRVKSFCDIYLYLLWS